jgi:hypothetical protein
MLTRFSPKNNYSNARRNSSIGMSGGAGPFDGARPGFVFKTGDLGTGYYADWQALRSE